MRYRSGIDRKISTALAFLVIALVGAAVSFSVLHIINQIDFTSAQQAAAFNS